MGVKGVEILDLDVKKLIQMLNEALCEEWLAYYQYWIGSRMMEGPMRSEIEPELMIHATQEFNHATLVVTRIIQLGGTPVLNPADWMKFAKCPYEAPIDPYVEVILNQNLSGERCAIQRYKGIADYTNGKDHHDTPDGHDHPQRGTRARTGHRGMDRRHRTFKRGH
jgi:bacterioferritin